MKRFLFAAACALLIASCDQAAPPAPEPSVESAIEPSAPEAPVVESDSFTDTDDTPLTREELLGMWSTSSGCGQPTVFSEDGSFTDYTGQTGRWTLANDRLTQTSDRGSYTNRTNQFNANTFAIGESGGLFVIYRRC
jgi:hypothetical protein